MEFHSPLLHSSSPVSNDLPRLSRGLSHQTQGTACARFTPNKSGQRLPPTYYRGCWHVVSRGFLVRYRQGWSSYSPTCSSLTTEFYDPKTFFTHAALLRQTFVHCGRFPTAASRRSLGRVSVPMWPITLSGRLRIIVLVSHYLTNQLIRRGSIHKRQHKGRLSFLNHAIKKTMRYQHPFPDVIPLLWAGYPRVTHPSATIFSVEASFHRKDRSTCMYQARRQRSS
eukprot:TRINITY_DN3460_c0_g2_i2.p1 TRINITY_DN3460_c0_g2~~TRINITY_DN3460_c0_g2_i2.p1  ORF type:complete len:225 (+),score=-70.64 TRINITY_DN3460_c0_g2_i2:308-982(+)